MVFIYILKLEHGKYYIGKTNNPLFRLEEHFNSNGSEWTKIYKPLKILEIKKDCDDYDEDKITIQYMDKYGIDNVRGGSFVSVKLDKSTINTLQKMSNSSNNKCFICGNSGHFAKNCNNNQNYESLSSSDNDSEYEDVWICSHCEKEFADEEKCIYHEKKCSSKIKLERYNSHNYGNYCYRCGRNGHYSTYCYASTHIKGYYLN